MSETACAATPSADLERQIMDPNVPKNEREWWAALEIERLRKRHGWQPIETAPKDGTYVLIIDNDARQYWTDDVAEWMFMARFDVGHWRIAVDEQSINSPSHWMPLPSPPKP